MEAVATPEIGGVTLRRHVLDIEASRMLHIARRLGLRLRRWFQHEPEMRPKLQLAMLPPGVPAMVPVLDGAGQPVLEVNLPPEDWRESLKLYQKTVADLLQEQRMRASLKPAARPALSDEDADAELLAFVRALPAEERARLLEASETIEATASETPITDEEI